MPDGERARTEQQDAELQAALARDGLAALDQLLTGQPAGDSIACARIGALIRLIQQAAVAGARH